MPNEISGAVEKARNGTALVNIPKIAFFYSLHRILPYLPHRFSAMLADAIGMLCRRGQQAKVIENELKALFGDMKSELQVKQSALESVVNHKKDLFEIWSFPRLNSNRMGRLVQFEGIEHLDRALEKGMGVVIGVSHFGSWKIIIAALVYKGYKVNQIGLDPRYFIGNTRPAHHNAIMEMEYKSEVSLPANFIYVGKYLRPVFRALKNNELVIDSFDGFMGSKKVNVPFFNGEVSLSTAPAAIAVRSGAPLVPIFAVRQKNNRHRIIIHEEIALDSRRDKDRAITVGVEGFAQLLRYYVNEYPSHYGRALYDRFRDPHR
jgi:KDO2-lipid IV(A) lauroyltransferase